MSEVTMVEAVREGLRSAMAEDERVMLLGEDVATLGGVFRASDGLLAEFGPERVVDTPMAELSIVGISIGLALRGMRPIAEIQFADFIYAATDQILSEAARYRFRTAGAWGVPLVIRTPWGAGIHGALYHSQSIEAVFSHFPGLKVVAASTPADAAGLLLSAIHDPDPVLVLEHKLAYRRTRGELGEPPERVPIGRARVAREGSDVTVIAYGWMVHEGLAAAATLAGEGIDLEVVDVRTLMPLDRDTIAASAQKTGRVCVVHEDVRTLGFGAEVSATLSERCFGDLAAPVTRLAMPDVAGTPYADGLEQALIPDAPRIADAARELARAVPRAPGRSVAPGAYGAVPQASMTMAVTLGDWVDGDLAGPLVFAVAQALATDREANGVYADGAVRLNESVNVQLVEPGDSGERRMVIPRAEELSRVGVERFIARARSRADAAGEKHPTVSVIVAGGGALFGVPRVEDGQTLSIQAGVVHDEVVGTGRGVEVRRQANLTISADHRVLDGAGCARVLAAVSDMLEQRA